MIHEQTRNYCCFWQKFNETEYRIQFSQRHDDLRLGEKFDKLKEQKVNTRCQREEDDEDVCCETPNETVNSRLNT